LGITALMSGDVAAAVAHHEDAARLEDIPRDRAQTQIVGQDQSVSFRSYFAMSLWLAGQAARAQHMIEQSVRFAEDGGHVGSLGYALTHAIIVAQGLGLSDQAAAWTERLVERATEYRLDMWRDYATFYAAVSNLATGPDASVDDAFKARTGLRNRSVGLMMASQDLRAADLLLDHERITEAVIWLDFAESSLAPGRECWSLPEHYRLRGRVAATARDYDQAISFTRQAVQSAEHSGALALQLKAAVQLVNFQVAAGHVPEMTSISLLVTARDGCDTLPGWTEALELLARFS
jgi:tetratricopeptide (TPR) repeat protein